MSQALSLDAITVLNKLIKHKCETILSKKLDMPCSASVKVHRFRHDEFLNADIVILGAHDVSLMTINVQGTTDKAIVHISRINDELLESKLIYFYNHYLAVHIAVCFDVPESMVKIHPVTDELLVDMKRLKSHLGKSVYDWIKIFEKLYLTELHEEHPELYYHLVGTHDLLTDFKKIKLVTIELKLLGAKQNSSLHHQEITFEFFEKGLFFKESLAKLSFHYDGAHQKWALHLEKDMHANYKSAFHKLINEYILPDLKKNSFGIDVSFQ